MRFSLFCLLSSILLLSCQSTPPSGAESAPEPPFSITPLPSPASANTSLPYLTTSAAGQVYMSWVAQVADTAQLWYAAWQGEAWAAPRHIAAGTNWFVNWADFPAILIHDSLHAAHWLQKSATGVYDYNVMLQLSGNGGMDWNPPMVAHQDGVDAEHGFVSMLPYGEGKVFATWLDGRFTKQENGAMTLRAGVFDTEGNVLEAWELDRRVCDCCQTSATMTSQGPVVLYRDRSEDEIRDIYQVRMTAEGWTEPEVVYPDQWNIAGCPVNGPAVASQGELMAAVWYAAPGGKGTVKVTTSQNGGETYEGVLVLSEATIGRVDVAITESHEIAVTWVDLAGEEGKIQLARLTAQGALVDQMTLATTRLERSSGFPQLTTQGNDLYVAYTDMVEGQSQVRVVKTTLD